MDLKPPTTIINTVATADSPGSDGETRIHSQLIKPFSSFPNGKHHHHHHHQPLSMSMSVSYKECLKNHAATIGSHALDGCGEFMQSPTQSQTQSQNPSSLTCAACGCHRNFHRREPTTKLPHFIEFHHPSSPHMVATPGTPVAIKIENPNGRKRFRTKFSQEQKEKMSNFAEKVGWKMQRCDDKMVFDFCNEIGIRRGIFKVWMHNNKNTFGKKDKETSSPTTTTTVKVTGDDVTTTTMGVVACNISNGIVVNVNSNSSDHQGDGGGGDGDGDGVHLQASNGSSSSC